MQTGGRARLLQGPLAERLARDARLLHHLARVRGAAASARAPTPTHTPASTSEQQQHQCSVRGGRGPASGRQPVLRHAALCDSFVSACRSLARQPDRSGHQTDMTTEKPLEVFCAVRSLLLLKPYIIAHYKVKFHIFILEKISQNSIF